MVCKKVLKKSILAVVAVLGFLASGHVKHNYKLPFSGYNTVTPSLAQADTCDDLVQYGRNALIAHNLAVANDYFQQAVDCNPSHQEANFFYAMTRLVSLLNGTEAKNIMDRFGISTEGRDIYNWTADFQYDQEGRTIWPPDSPTVDELIGTLNNTVLPEIEEAFSNLEKVVDIDFNIMLHQDEILTDVPMEADRGDVLAAKAFLTAAKGAINILNAYNLSLDIDELIALTDDGGIANINDFFSFNPNFFTLKSGAGTQLAKAKAFLKEAINGYFTASEFIRSENDDQGDDLIAFDSDEPVEEENFGILLGDIKDSLDGPQQFCGKTDGYYNLDVSGNSSGFIRLERDLCESSIAKLDYEDFSVTGDGEGPYSGIKAILPFATHSPPLKYFPPKAEQTWSSSGNSNGYRINSTSEVKSVSETVSVAAGNFTNCAKVEETLTYPYGYTPGQAYPIKFERWFAPGIGPVKLVIHQSDGGTYSGGLTSYQNIPGGQNDYFPLGLNYSWTFTMNGGRSATWVVTSAKEEIEHFTVDASKFFNGLDIQNHLPDFDDCDRPVYGTLPDPTLNGLLPDYDRNHWWDNIFSLSEYYVNAATGNDENIGNTPGSPLKTISEAARRADNWGFGSDEEGCGITIDVAAGTYNRASGESFPIDLEDDISLQGSGAGSTTIDASGGTDSVVDIDRGTLDGFTITGGNGYHGGGVAAGHTTVSNCIITGNTAYNGGAGIAAYNSLVKDCTISNNHGGDGNEWGSHGGGISSDGSIISNCVIRDNSVNGGGGGMSLHHSPTSIANCIITGNSAGWGGGIQHWQSSPTITDCTISSNTASDSGGGIKSDESSPIITNSLITDNTASNGGGGIDCWQSSPKITNCTFNGNTANWGGGINLNGVSSLVIVNTILWGNEAGSNPNEINQSYQSFVSINYSDFNPSYFSGSLNWSGSNNINENPLFLSSIDYHLQPGSPCIDAANSNDPAPATDKDGRPRYDDPNTVHNTGTGANGSYYDMGVYEYQGACSSGETRSCDTGLSGICTDGTQSCDGSGNWGVCVQHSQSSDELCDDGIDNDCDGKTDEGCSKGDVNIDGNLTPQDALMTFQHYLGLIELDASQQALADVNNSGSITPADALCIFQKYLGLSSCLD